MVEFTRVLTIQVTQIMECVDMFADDVEKDTCSKREQEKALEKVKRTFSADDVQMQTQLFRREVDE